MKLKEEINIIHFLNAIKKCKHDVYYVTRESDRLNLSSQLSEYVFLATAARPELIANGAIALSARTRRSFMDFSLSVPVYLQWKSISATYPIILTDKLGFTRIAGCQKHNDTVVFYHLFGPVFTVEASEAYIRKSCKELNLPAELVPQLLSRLQNVPIVSLDRCIDYAIMLYFRISDGEIISNQIVIQEKIVNAPENVEWFDSEWNGTWAIEQMIFNSIYIIIYYLIKIIFLLPRFPNLWLIAYCR